MLGWLWLTNCLLDQIEHDSKKEGLSYLFLNFPSYRYSLKDTPITDQEPILDPKKPALLDWSSQ
jgi:hypothetical protein